MAKPVSVAVVKEKNLGTFLGKVKVAQLHIGSDLMGSKGTINHRESMIDAYEWGLHVKSRKTGRTFLIYSNNLRGTEMLPDETGTPEQT